jgi:ATP-dependent Zn protease
LQEKVDEQVTKFIAQGEKRAMELLKKHKKELELISTKLLEVETIDADEFVQLMAMPKATHKNA